MRGRGSLRAPLALALASCALAVMPAAPASAGITSTIVAPITVGVPGTGSTFQVTVTSLLGPPGNTQAVVGQFGPTPFAGLLVFHSFDRATDTGHYRITGATAAGTPLDSLIDISVDRSGSLVIVGLNGFAGSTPFALSRSVTLPI